MWRPVVIATLALALAGHAVAAGEIRLPEAERIVLDNGTVLVLVEKHDVPLIGIEAIVRGGSVADPADRFGLTELLAALLSRGAGDRDAAAFALAVDALGARLDVSAEREYVSLSAAFLARDADTMVGLVADALRRPRLDAAEIAKLRERSINFIKAARSSDPSNLLPLYANAFVFGEHPYGNPPGGSETTLGRITAADLRQHYANHFGGDRLTLVVAGDFETDDMRARLTEAFGDWGPAATELPPVDAPSPAAGGRVLLIDKPGATQTYFAIGNVGVSRHFAERAALDIANTEFGGRFSSMLVTALRVDSGLTYSVSSRLTRYSQPGAFMIRSFTETGTTAAAIDLALATLARLQDEGLAAGTIDAVRNYISGQYPLGFETAAQLARQFALLEAYGLDTDYVETYGAQLAAATPESVTAVIDAVYPRADDLVFVLIGDADAMRDVAATYGTVTEMRIDAPAFRPPAAE